MSSKLAAAAAYNFLGDIHGAESRINNQLQLCSLQQTCFNRSKCR
jgi:hypothetical protein